MFNVGGGEFLVIFLVALVVLGPTKLPEAARQVGKWMGEFRKLSAGFQAEVRQAMDDPVTHAVKKAEAAEPLATDNSVGDATDETESTDPTGSTEPTTSSGNDDKPKHERTAIPPLAPMAGSAALTNAKPNDTDSAGTATGSADEPPEANTPDVADDGNADDVTSIDPPMFGDR